jgi:signal transduction histidine kinase
LLIMQERLHAVGGSLRIESRPGAGTSVMARLGRAQ